MNTTEQLTAALQQVGVPVGGGLQFDDDPSPSVERYKAAKPGNFWREFTRGLAQGMGGRFEERLHPRGGKGTKQGGKFVSKGAGGGGPATGKPPKAGKTPTPTPAQPAGKYQTLSVDGHRYDVAQKGKDWYARPAGDKKSQWRKVAKRSLGKLQDEMARSQFERQQQVAAQQRRRLEGHKRFILDAIKAGPKNGSAIWKSMGIPKDDFLDAYFALADAGQVEQDQATGAVSLKQQPPKPRAARAAKPKQSQPAVSPVTGQPLATNPQAAMPQPVTVKPQRTPEEEKALAEAREKTRQQLAERLAAGKKEAREAKRQDDAQRLQQTAEDYGIPPEHLTEAAKFIHSEKLQQHRERERVKSDARSSTGLTLNDIKRLENSGRDFTTVETRGLAFDKAAQSLGRAYPGVFGPDPSEWSAKLWDLLREGAQQPPSMHDPEILREAARFVEIHQDRSPKREPGEDDDNAGELVGVGDLEEVPFSNPGRPERYQRYCRWRQSRRLAEAFRAEYTKRRRHEFVVKRYTMLFREYQQKSQRDKILYDKWNEADHPRGQPENKGEFVEKSKQTIDERPAGDESTQAQFVFKAPLSNSPTAPRQEGEKGKQTKTEESGAVATVHETRLDDRHHYRWRIVYEPPSSHPWLSPRLAVMEQLRYTNGGWARETVAESYSDGSGLLNALLGTETLDHALAEFASINGQSIESYKSGSVDLITLHEHEKANRQKISSAEKGDPCFVRFGAIPKNGRSWNHRDGYAEAGVSVYRARKTNGKIYIYLAGTDRVSAMFIAGSAPMYVVSGEEIGVGADGEPLLKNCRGRRSRLAYEIIS